MMVAALALAGLQCASVPAVASEPLTICLDEDIPLYSVHHGGEGSGFVLAVSQAIARQLDRPLKIQWFESKVDPDDSSVLGANASALALTPSQRGHKHRSLIAPA